MEMDAPMACCAFAVFLLIRLLAPLRAMMRALGFARTERKDAAVAWSLATVTPAPKRAAASRRHGLLSHPVLAVEALVLAALAGPAVASAPLPASASATDPAIIALIHKNICAPLGWRN
ncbi:hypothetical protein [Novosphingobium olei]|uniref:hypothetical protein n=1 Tax=Novosphingobium olei TaxID=2728851 RepID=UPI00308C844C|nr:hypothetical protein NSDW_13030 [Novosphingobium olei]